MTKYFICITTWQNYKICEEKGLWGVEEHRVGDLRKSSKGDIFIFYLKKEDSMSKAGTSGAIFERESEMDLEERESLWEDGLYPFRVNIRLLDNSIRYKKFYPSYLYDIGVVKNKTSLGPWLNTSMQEISERDYNELVNMIKSNAKPT